MRSTVRLPSGLFAFLRERYDYDAATITWTIDSPQSALWGPMHQTAAPWLGREWRFTGTGSAPSAIGEMGPERPMRMIYTTIGDDSFHRQHQVRGDGTWQTYSEETCYRDSAPRPRPTLIAGTLLASMPVGALADGVNYTVPAGFNSGTARGSTGLNDPLRRLDRDQTPSDTYSSLSTFRTTPSRYLTFRSSLRIGGRVRRPSSFRRSEMRGHVSCLSRVTSTFRRRTDGIERTHQSTPSTLFRDHSE